MIAMQYSIVLPADYDMGIIDRRIAEKGSFTDGFPGLRFKAYLNARPGQISGSESDKLYAPFYLWDSVDGMNAFLCGPGFAALSRAFGRPVVKTWSIWAAAVGEDIEGARYATREAFPIPRHADLGALREAECARARSAGQGAIATVAGFDPANWSALRFCLWTELPEQPAAKEWKRYAVGHVSTGNPDARRMPARRRGRADSPKDA